MGGQRQRIGIGKHFIIIQIFSYLIGYKFTDSQTEIEIMKDIYKLEEIILF